MRSAGDQPVAAEHVPDLGEGRVGHGQDQVGGVQRLGLVRDSGRAYAVQQGRERLVERRVVAALDRSLDLRVQLVEGRDGVVRDVELALAENADDHFWSSVVVAASADWVSASGDFSRMPPSWPP